jgi:hypothetical protein
MSWRSARSILASVALAAGWVALGFVWYAFRRNTLLGVGYLLLGLAFAARHLWSDWRRWRCNAQGS